MSSDSCLANTAAALCVALLSVAANGCAAPAETADGSVGYEAPSGEVAPLGSPQPSSANPNGTGASEVPSSVPEPASEGSATAPTTPSSAGPSVQPAGPEDEGNADEPLPSEPDQPAPTPTMSTSPVPAEPEPATPSAAPTPTSPLEPPLEEAPDNDAVYDPDVVQTFELELPGESLDALRERTRFDDPANEVYVHGTLRYGDTLVEDVGVRFKGEGSFRPLDAKSAWKIKLDEFVPGQNLSGLKRLTFNNMVEDPSFLAERLAYHVYRALNLPAPRCNAALVLVNGAPYGLYANIEAEDKPFLRRWFASDDGNLYEEGQSDFVPGAETSFALQTNEEGNDRSDLIAVIDAVESVASGAPWSDLDAVLNTAHFLRFTAAEAAVNQWDMYAYTRFYPNNFRLYSDPLLGMTFLPWGMDMSMKPFRDSGKPHVRIFEVARQGDFDGGQVIAGRIYRLCLEDPVCIEEFSAAVSDVADVYEALDLEVLAERYYEQILPLVEADPRKEYSMQEFEAGYQSLLSTIRERPQAMRADLAER